MRLILDEHLSVDIAVELRRCGYDVVAVTEGPDLVGLEDRELFEWAIGAGRVVVTRDIRGFGPLAEEHQTADEAFPGVILLSSGRYPQQARSSGAIVRDLAELADAHPAPDALTGRVMWLGGQ